MSIGKGTPNYVDTHDGDWAVRIQSQWNRVDGHALVVLGHLRKHSDVQTLTEADCIWLRGASLNEQICTLLRSLPDAECFVVLPDNQLAHWNETVPRATLPEGLWQPILKSLTVMLPAALFAPRIEPSVPLRLARSAFPIEGNLLRTTWKTWRDYAIAASQIRLNQLSFAASPSEALVRGTPLPPIPGELFVEAGGVAIPLGWRTDPELDAQSIRRLIEAAEETMVLLHENGSVELILESAFVRATRSAVKMSDTVDQNTQ
jgi:hypothetical protein